MKDFFLNFTKILETNSKIYWSIIAGIVACLILYIAEIIHIQSIYPHISSLDSTVVRTIIDAIAQRYQWGRIAVILIALIASIFQYRKTKKILNLG